MAPPLPNEVTRAHPASIPAADRAGRLALYPMCVLGLLGSALMWPAAYQSVVTGRMPPGMLTWMMLGTPLVIWQLANTARVAGRTRTPEDLLVVLVVLGSATGNLIVDGELVVGLVSGAVEFTPADAWNLALGLTASVLILGWFARRRDRDVRQGTWAASSARTVTMTVCLLALATRIAPGTAMLFSGRLSTLGVGMLAGYCLIALQRLSMTGLQRNHLLVRARLEPTDNHRTALRIVTWVFRTDLANITVAGLLLACWWIGS